MYEKYSDVKNYYDEIKQHITRDFDVGIARIEEAIRFQYFFGNKMANYIDKANVSEITLKNKVGISHMLYSRSRMYINAAHTLTLNGQPAPANSLLRVVFESILAQYYASLCDDDDLKNYINELDPNIKHKKYGFNYFKQKLYVGDVLNQVSNSYRTLSSFNHANPATLIDITYDKGRVQDTQKFVLQMSLFNVLSYVQVYKLFQSDILLKNIGETIIPFINKMFNQLNKNLIPLFPNKPELTDKLVISASVSSSN